MKNKKRPFYDSLWFWIFLFITSPFYVLISLYFIFGLLFGFEEKEIKPLTDKEAIEEKVKVNQTQISS